MKNQELWLALAEIAKMIKKAEDELEILYEARKDIFNQINANSINKEIKRGKRGQTTL